MRQLEAKIQTVNKVNEIKNYLFPLLKTVLQDFVGCKVTKVNHALLKDVESLLIPIENKESCHEHHSNSFDH